ncbi:hypothetical protein D3C78_1549680 [compost metagenome]
MTLIDAGASLICCSKPLAVTTTVSIVFGESLDCAQTAAGPTPSPAAQSAAANRVRDTRMRPPRARSLLLMIPLSPVPDPRRTLCATLSPPLIS